MFADLSKHPEWLQPQSKPWCDQLAAQTGAYVYPWNYITEGTSGEDVLTDELSRVIHGKVLDVGCGHGEYTNTWADQAEEVVGYDMTEGFIETANRNRRPNVRFIMGQTHNGLPFADGEFDVIYTKKGPTSCYPEASRILRPGGRIVSLHPGDHPASEPHLSHVFPGLFSPSSEGTPILDKIKQRLSESSLAVTEIRVLRETGYIPDAEDIAAMKCFGQNERITEAVRVCMKDIRKQFDRYRTPKGLPVTGFYYLILAKAGNGYASSGKEMTG